MSKGLNWSGIANSLNKLKNLAEPNYFEKEEHRAFTDRIEYENKNKIQETEDKFEFMYKEYFDGQDKINTGLDNLNTISDGLAGIYKRKYKQANESDPKNVIKLLNDNDWHNINHLEKMNDDISEQVYSDIEALEDINQVYDNAAYGSMLFKNEKNLGGYYIDEEGNKVSSWEIDGNPGLTENELERALEGTLRMEEIEFKKIHGQDATYDTRGIREGFWAGYNKTSRMKDNLAISDKIGDMVKSGKADSSEEVKAWVESNKRFYRKQFDKEFDSELYFESLDDLQVEYMEIKQNFMDWDNEDNNGPKEGTEDYNPYWTTDNSLASKDIMTPERKKLGDRIGAILVEGVANGYGHYFTSISPQNFKTDFDIFIGGSAPKAYKTDGNLLTERQGTKRKDKEGILNISYDEAGLSNDFYLNLTKDLRVPVWQDVTFSADLDGQTGLVDVQAQTAWLEGEEGKKWSYEFKKEFEFVQQFIENYALHTTDKGVLSKPVVSEEDAKRFNKAMDIFWKAYPSHFEGKVRLGVNVMSNKDGSRYYYLHDVNSIQ